MKKICSMMIPLSLGIYLSNTTSLNAAIQWLPDALEEGLKFSGFKSYKDGHSKDNDCSDYDLIKCPTGWKFPNALKVCKQDTKRMAV